MEKEKKNLIVFGYGLAVILAFIGFKIWHDHGWIAIHGIFTICIIALVLVTALNYKSLKPFYKRWMQVAHFIGSIITGIILSILYYFVFGVVGIILRLLKKDLLDRQIDQAVNSYWIQREQTSFDKNHYTKQY